MEENCSRELSGTETTVNGIRIVTEGDVTHFIPIETECEEKKEEEGNCGSEHKSGFWESVLGFLKRATPYANTRNLSDPFGDKNYEGGTKSAAEIGLKWKW